MIVYKINDSEWVAGKTKQAILDWYCENGKDKDITTMKRVNIRKEGLFIPAIKLTESQLNNDVKMFHKISGEVVAFMTFATVLKSMSDGDGCYLLAALSEDSEEGNN